MATIWDDMDSFPIKAECFSLPLIPARFESYLLHVAKLIQILASYCHQGTVNVNNSNLLVFD
jgi:hypothetical protein